VPLFGTDIFPYSTNFSELHAHTTFHISFSNNQHINYLWTGYSIILIFNLFYFALNVIRAPCTFTKTFTKYFLILIYSQENYNLILSRFCLQVKMFLQTMVMYPPVVSVGGFANVDRGLFRAVSNLKRGLGCCKEQFFLILRNSLKINLQKCGGRLVPVRLIH
jgi:hypothetical protein